MNQRVILSASRRTDLPAFHTDWFLAQLKAGECTYPNPIRRGISHTVDLHPGRLAGIVFWSRWPRPLMQHLDSIDALNVPYYFQFTIVGYPESVDPHSPDIEHATTCFIELAQRLGPHRVVWRYDPVILSDSLTVEWHIAHFNRLLAALQGHTERLVLSVIDPYPRILPQLTQAGLHNVLYDPGHYVPLLTAITESAHAAGIREVTTCVEPALNIKGVAPGRCVDADLLQRIAADHGAAPRISHAQHNLRTGCLCHRSVDIGTGNTCQFGCAYCYANRHSRQTA